MDKRQMAGPCVSSDVVGGNEQTSADGLQCWTKDWFAKRAVFHKDSHFCSLSLSIRYPLRIPFFNSPGISPRIHWDFSIINSLQSVQFLKVTIFLNRVHHFPCKATVSGGVCSDIDIKPSLNANQWAFRETKTYYVTPGQIAMWIHLTVILGCNFSVSNWDCIQANDTTK